MSASLPQLSLPYIRQELAGFQPKTIQTNLPEAAVLLAVTQETHPKIVFTQRASHLNSHAGQVAFPGGKRDAEDLNLYNTALREAEEEIGLSQKLVQPLGKLSDVVSLHGIKVTPYIGLIPKGLEYVPSLDELDAVFSVPLDWFYTDPRSHTDVIPLTNQHKIYVPSYNFQGFTIWGLTAMILVEFLQVGCKMPIDLNTVPQGKLLNRPLRPLPVT